MNRILPCLAQKLKILFGNRAKLSTSSVKESDEDKNATLF